MAPPLGPFGLVDVALPFSSVNLLSVTLAFVTWKIEPTALLLFPEMIVAVDPVPFEFPTRVKEPIPVVVT